MVMARVPLRADAQWIDDVAVERYLDGQKVGRSLTYRERQEVVRRRFQRFVEAQAKQLRVTPADVLDGLAPQFRQRERAARRERAAQRADQMTTPEVGEQLRVA